MNSVGVSRSGSDNLAKFPPMPVAIGLIRGVALQEAMASQRTSDGMGLMGPMGLMGLGVFRAAPYAPGALQKAIASRSPKSHGTHRPYAT
jgi:hypothetical protein